MTKSDLVSRLCKIYPYMNIKNVDRVLTIIIDQIIDKLSKGGRVELRDFGAFFVREKPGMLARNPRTGQRVTVGIRKVSVFKPGKGLKYMLNNKEIDGEY